MAQNTSDNSECLAESWRIEALEGKTDKTEDIARDVDSRKCLEYFDARNFIKFKYFWKNIRSRGLFSANAPFIVANRQNI